MTGMLRLLLSAVLTVALGWGLVRLVLLRSFGTIGWTLRLSVAVLLGLGVTSCSYFLWAWTVAPRNEWYILVELLLAAGLVATAAILARQSAPVAGQPPVGVEGPRSSAIALWALTAAAVLAAGHFLATSARHPHGAWDAWMTWNLHARFIFRGGEGWLMMFSEQGSLRHPDYPFLVPSLVARGWMYATSEWKAVPVSIAFLFTAATAAIVVGALGRLRERSQALIGGILLLSTPFFIAHGASQYADVPVAAYLAASVVLLALYERGGRSSGGMMVLAGLAVALAAWTKNEGLLFVVAVPLAWFIVSAVDRQWKPLLADAVRFSLGALPVMLVVVAFKTQLAPPGEWSPAADGLRGMMSRLLEPERHVYVAKGFARAILDFGRIGPIGVLWIVAGYALLVGVRERIELRQAAHPALVVLLVLAGHSLAYVTAPGDMQRLFDGSVDRLLLQLWPTTLFALFLALRNPAAISPGEARSGATTAS